MVLIITSFILGVNCVKLPFFPENLNDFLNFKGKKKERVRTYALEYSKNGQKVSLNWLLSDSFQADPYNFKGDEEDLVSVTMPERERGGLQEKVSWPYGSRGVAGSTLFPVSEADALPRNVACRAADAASGLYFFVGKGPAGAERGKRDIPAPLRTAFYERALSGGQCYRHVQGGYKRRNPHRDKWSLKRQGRADPADRPAQKDIRD